MFEGLLAKGFDIETRNHAGAILRSDFPDAVREIETALLAVSIPAEELIASGGGEAQSTQRLRRALAAEGWPKHQFDFQMVVDGRTTVSNSHEIDHVRRFAAGTLALEIEWNNKDPFFDRDLENFHRLHAQSAISVGILITRGESLQAAMEDIVRSCIEKHGLTDESQLVETFGMKDRTRRQSDAVAREMALGQPFAEAFARHFVRDKFGSATTHWKKLVDRIGRGVGNPCPLVLIGLPVAVVVR